MTALPGSGLVLADAANRAYLSARAEPADQARLLRKPNAPQQPEVFLTAGNGLEALSAHHAYRLIDPPADWPSFACDFSFDPGRRVTGKVVDEGGKPVSGAGPVPAPYVLMRA